MVEDASRTGMLRGTSLLAPPLRLNTHRGAYGLVSGCRLDSRHYRFIAFREVQHLDTFSNPFAFYTLVRNFEEDCARRLHGVCHHLLYPRRGSCEKPRFHRLAAG